MARNIFTKGTAITLAWHFTKPDGTSFDLSGYQLRLFYGVGSRYTEVSDYTLGTNASNELEDFITWTFAADKQVTAGDYKMKLQIYQNGHLFTTMNYNNAFSLFQGTPYSSNDEQQEEEANVVNLYTAAEFYLFNPIVPTVGTDGYWYVNGVLVLDGDDNPIPSFYNVVYDESTRWLSIYKGDQTDPHNPDPEPVQVIKDVDNALKHWQEQYETEEGSRAESVAGDGSRWGSYKTAETNRNAAYAEEEGSLAGSTAADDDRWGKYKLAEDLRDTAYAEQEGTAASEAGSNDRWGKYKTAEAARNTARETAEGSSSSTAGDGSRWGAYKTAENERDAARATVEGTNASAAGDGTRWGAYKTAENNRDSARLAAEGDSSSTAGDGSRWGSYKSAEANRDTARETAEGTAASEAGDGTRWGSYKTAEASRNTAYAGEEGTLAGSTAADNDRWGKYKAAEAARETAYETAEGDATAEAGDANRWGAYKTAEAARGTAFDSAEATRNAGMAPLVGIFDCSTAAATAQKEVAASNYVLANGGAFKVKFTYANSASSPTLKINSETAKAIVFNGAEASADNTWGAGEVVEFYYDPSYDSNTGGFIGRSSVISVSQNTETGKEELKIGNTAALVIDNEPEAGSDNLVKSGGVKKFVDERTFVESYNNAETDLDIVDMSGNVLARFSEGNFRTKNFDSANTPSAENNIKNMDLDIADENGNVLALFKNGHIRTKNFDSANLHEYADKPASGFENFLVQVNTAIANNVEQSSNLQDSINLQNDRCIINFPSNYSPRGEALRLVIAGQSSSGRIQADTTMVQKTVPNPNVLLAEGFAVLQVNGTPGYTDGINTYGGMASPQYLQSVQLAYQYVVNKYNIKKDGVLLCGWSQGTLKVQQIAMNKIVPVKAMALFGPALDLWKVMYTFADMPNRKAMMSKFGFTEQPTNSYVLDLFSNIYNSGDTVTLPLDSQFSAARHVPTDYEFAYILNNFEMWVGYDPICWGTSKNIIAEQFRHRSPLNVQDSDEDACFADVANVVPCPTKMFVALDDNTTPSKVVSWYKTMADNAGMKCDVRRYGSGGHNYSSLVDYPTIQVQTKYGSTITTNVPSWEGMLFLERYDKN